MEGQLLSEHNKAARQSNVFLKPSLAKADLHKNELQSKAVDNLKSMPQRHQEEEEQVRYDTADLAVDLNPSNVLVSKQGPSAYGRVRAQAKLIMDLLIKHVAQFMGGH